jgi:hypothetical protein
VNRDVAIIQDEDDDEVGTPESVAPGPLRTAISKVTAKDVNAAAKSAGMVGLNAKAIRSSKVFGKYVRQQGAIEVGTGLYWLAAHNLARAMNKCAELIEDPPEPNEDCNETETKVITGLLGVMRHIGKEMVKCAEGVSKVEKLSKESVEVTEPVQQPFQKGQMLVPIHTNSVTINEAQKPR